MQLTATQIRGIRRLLLSAVLRTEEADLRLGEVSVVRLREQLLLAAAELTRAAEGLTHPAALNNEEAQ